MNSKWQPALWGGLFVGVLSALPFINLGNCLCCMWVVIGGLIAAYLVQKASPIAITVLDGGLAGVVAGATGAVLNTILSFFFSLFMAPFWAGVFRRAAENNPDLPPEFRDALFTRFAAGSIGLTLAFGLVSVVVFSIFGGIGGMIGAQIFNINKRQVVVAQPPPYTPPPSYIPPSPPAPPPPPPAPPTEPPQ